MSIINYQFIVYACPVGELNKQLEDYFQQTLHLYGRNTAHNYMPHCTLTGFFTDKISSISYYGEALDRAYLEANHNNLSLDIEIKKLTFNENWHGLELQADGLKKLITRFVEIENSPTRYEEIRLKDWLHLSLAYDFNPQYQKKLKQLAMKIINIKADVHWELRFYQKNQDWTWNTLQSWQLS